MTDSVLFAGVAFQAGRLERQVLISIDAKTISKDTDWLEHDNKGYTKAFLRLMQHCRIAVSVVGLSESTVVSTLNNPSMRVSGSHLTRIFPN